MNNPDDIHIHEGTGTYDPDVPESAFKNPKLEDTGNYAFASVTHHVDIPDRTDNDSWREWNSNDDIEAGAWYETYKDENGQRWIRDA